MRNGLACLGLVAVALIGSHTSLARADTYFYKATCEGSYSKQGSADADLTTHTGKPIGCDAVVLSLPANRHVLIQIPQKAVDMTALGFAGDQLDYKMNPNFVTLPLRRLYLPHLAHPSRPEVVDGIEGFCFIDAKANIISMTQISCAAKVELGTDKLIYNIQVRVLGAGERVAGGP
jgi:hypothetical protein